MLAALIVDPVSCFLVLKEDFAKWRDFLRLSPICQHLIVCASKDVQKTVARLGIGDGVERQDKLGDVRSTRGIRGSGLFKYSKL
jgi:hypothetical protein